MDSSRNRDCFQPFFDPGGIEDQLEVRTAQKMDQKAQPQTEQRKLTSQLFGELISMQFAGSHSCGGVYRNVGRGYGHKLLLLLVVVIAMLVPVQCFTYNHGHRRLSNDVKTSLTMRFPAWFPQLNPNRPNSIWPSMAQPKVSVDVYSEEKKSLLRAIAATRTRKSSSSSLESSGEGSRTDRQSILSCVSVLETMYAKQRQSTQVFSRGVQDVLISPNQCADGAWSLIYSTKQSSTTNPSLFASSSILSTWVDKISGELYKVFFRFAPLLAGGQDESNQQQQGSNQIVTTKPNSVSNKQLIDLANGKVVNVVTFENALLTKLFGRRQSPTTENDSSSSDGAGRGVKAEIRVIEKGLFFLYCPFAIP